MGLPWRLARCLKATLNLHWLEDTCVALHIFNGLAQLAKRGLQEPFLWGLAFPGVYSGRMNKLLVIWLLDSFCPKTFSADVMLTIMRAPFVQQFPAAVPAGVVRCFTDLIFARLWGGCYHPRLRDEEVEAQRGVRRSHIQEVPDLG